ncbi:TPA: TIGR03759 family integrating conjugative element protein [Raoultella planticola]|uniref:TIGR03759 family integrating conjugative element protein n=1 Tax=Enterobacteriaceae TaxID=543 RepID=UPI0009833F9D|nr:MULTISPECIES: TIGR03759 family integrating conjugative element protein [Enterobacteriaceae]EHK4263086.1 TIGR03759 family integrating conjugative element protein [Escherichia coli]HCR1855441.1 TIGR03759 family integrating conjugative element protein [Enterobacter kobei]HDZ0419386.1 TIGR03759 family integrating conjugative element protein [Klebsiella quasipneumoniae]MBA7948084.1 TIGR03759 family integrating conjugative element protein [Citrobacter freundii]MBJ9534878.1 TIGR03759 family integr
MKGKYLALLLTLATPLAQAGNETTSVVQNSTETPLSSHPAAQQWGLTLEEWSRYETLKHSERGIWSPSLDPLTLLGVEATTDAERQRYADLLVEKESQRVEKELAFQRAYDAAWKRRFPGLMPAVATTPDRTSRLAVFVREDCTACDTRLKTLLNAGNPLDIWLVGSDNNDSRLRRWAVSQHIDNTRVQRREVTLNHDAGRWLHYGQGKMPVVLEKQGDTWLPITAP